MASSRRLLQLLLAGLAASGVGLAALPILALFWEGLRKSAWQTTSSEAVQAALQLSLITSGISALIILLVGTPLAYGLARFDFRGKGVVASLVQLPIVMPPAVAGLALLLAFGRGGLIGTKLNAWFGVTLPFTEAAVVMAQVFVSLPFYLRTAQVGFQNVPLALEEAAHVDGADRLAILWRITLPLARRAMIAGLLLSWARALGEFGATILFAGNVQGKTRTLPLLVYTAFQQDIGAAVWTALILIVVALLTLVVTQLLMDRDKIES